MQKLINALLHYTIAMRDADRGHATGEDLDGLWARVEVCARPQGLTGDQALSAYLRRR